MLIDKLLKIENVIIVHILMPIAWNVQVNMFVLNALIITFYI